MLRRVRRLRLGLVLLVAIGVHACESYQFTPFDYDKIIHVSAALSWLKGRGFTIPGTGPGGPADPVYTPLLGHPPGYGYAVALAAHATHDPWWSTFAVDIAATTIFLVAWGVLVDAVFGWRAALGLLALWTVTYGPIATATSSDLLAMACYSASVASAGLVLSATGLPLLAGSALAGLLMGVTCGVRYAYWPLVVVVPLAILAARRDRQAAGFAAVYFAISMSAIAATAWFMRRTTGEAEFLTRAYAPAHRAFFWSQLRTVYPFPAEALGVDRLSVRLALGRPLLTAWMPSMLWMLSALVLALLAWSLWPDVRRTVDGRNDPRARFFLVGGLLTVGATLAEMLWLTVRLPAAADGWTVGAEARYFMPVLMFVSAWLWLAVRPDAGVSRPTRAAAIALLTLVVLATVPFRLVRLQQYFAKNVHTAWLSAERRERASVIIDAIRRADRGTVPPIVVDNDPKWRRAVATMGGALVVEPSALPPCVAGQPLTVLEATSADGRTDLDAALVSRVVPACAVR